MAMYSLPADQIMVSNIQHMHVNGKESTIFDVYRKHWNKYDEEVWVFAGREALRGTIKRESTILRKITNE